MRVATRTPRTFRWEDPPPAATPPPFAKVDQRSPWADTIARLQLQPGRWAVIYESGRGSCSSLAWSIRRGAMLGFEPVGTFEAVTRGPRIGLCRVYARYVGEGS